MRPQCRSVLVFGLTLAPHRTEYDFWIPGEDAIGNSKHTEAQIIAALKQIEAGRTVDDVARECGWGAKVGGSVGDTP